MRVQLLIRNVTVCGRHGLDVAIDGGRIGLIAPRLGCAADRVLDARGGELLPGLHDHHIHLLALGAQSDSVDLSGARDEDEAVARIRRRADGWSDGGWIRAIGYHEQVAGPLDRERLDRWSPHRPLRVQHATGTLWVFNGPALAELTKGIDGDDGPLERDGHGRLTGRLWHGDRWLKTRIPPGIPDLGRIGRQLAAWGVTAVTDASASTGDGEAAILAAAHADGRLPQRLHLMSAGALKPDPMQRYTIGPVKIMLHEAALPEFDQLVATIRTARHWRRSVAFHCITATELSMALAALDEAGNWPGDRIEHGAIIEESAIEELARRELTVVTQPAFIEERGDRYLRNVEANDLPHLYRCRSLLDGGVRVAASSDAPYADPDPWRAIRAASLRRSAAGRAVGLAEAVPAENALKMYLGTANDPGGPPRQLAAGAIADLCLLTLPLPEALAQPERAVGATLVAGRPLFLQPHMES